MPQTIRYTAHLYKFYPHQLKENKVSCSFLEENTLIKLTGLNSPKTLFLTKDYADAMKC